MGGFFLLFVLGRILFLLRWGVLRAQVVQVYAGYHSLTLLVVGLKGILVAISVFLPRLSTLEPLELAVHLDAESVAQEIRRLRVACPDRGELALLAHYAWC